ncbi:MAG: DUF998 domain-containing protein [Chloroflexota bacterium]|nr:DUF998 domain-containing protein [Chloroflexota bacterium]
MGTRHIQTSSIVRISGLFGIASQVMLVTVILLSIILSPWFSWTENFLSVLGVKGAATLLFNLGFVCSGVMSLLFAIGLGLNFSSRRLLGQIGAVCLTGVSFGLIGIGIVPRDEGAIHDYAAVLFFACIPLALVLIGVELFLLSSKVLGVFSIVAGGLAIGLQMAPWPWSGGAIPQVISSLPWTLWSVVLAVRLLRGAKGFGNHYSHSIVDGGFEEIS